jgi:Ni/Fe-hydrogenase subunit HybB-like protein
VVALILVVGIPVIIYRFVYGIGAVSNLTQASPWGLWIGLDVMSGVALAAGGFTIAAAVYMLGLKEYQPIVRPAILTGFLGYLFVVIGLMVDLGRPWNLPVPMVYSTAPVGDVRGGLVRGALPDGAGARVQPRGVRVARAEKARAWALRLALPA